MKGYFKTLILILLCLAVLIPFASEFPDGLEKVAETFGIEENEPLWKGVMPDYQMPIIDMPYISTLAASVFGVFLVFCATSILGIAMSKLRREK
ncbi:MAG: PDGLE domain-containing protein [Candidatus Bathycorpusculaceae bacterium]